MDYNLIEEINIMKTRKWYSTKIVPDRKSDLIVRTDMGYIFEAVYENDKFLVSQVKNNNVYFEEWLEQDSLIEWMKV